MKEIETKRMIRELFSTYSRLIWGIPLLLLIFASIAYGIFHYYQTKPRNIFDEIYYVEKDMYPQTNTVLNGIEGISTHSYIDASEEFRNSAEEGYDNNFVPKGYQDIGLSFYFKSEKFVFTYHKNIDSELKLAIFIKYFVKEKKITRSLRFADDKGLITDNKQITELRKQYNITDQVLEQDNQEILNNFFLRD